MKKIKSTENGDGEEPEGFLNIREVAVKLKVPTRLISRMKKSGAPFCEGKTRPEWILEWAKKNANDEARRKCCCRECMYYRPRDLDSVKEG